MSSHDPGGRRKGNELRVRSHAAVTSVARDTATFSSAVSRHLQFPNGFDGEAHARARALIDPFFVPAEVDELEPALVSIARQLVEELAANGQVFDAVGELGTRYAVHAQSAWLGWGSHHAQDLLAWVAEKRAATRGSDKPALARSAQSFDAFIARLLDERRSSPRPDTTMRLMMLRTHDGRALSDTEIVSILRNWTGGDLISIALCVGVVTRALSVDHLLSERLRDAPDDELDSAIDELLRIDDPFVFNRRVATRDAVVAGCPVSAEDRLTLDWRSANRDPAVFGDPDAFDPSAHAHANLVYGTGPHACPGRGLATRELRVLVRSLLRVGDLEPAGAPVREAAPAAGYASLPVRILVR